MNINSSGSGHGRHDAVGIHFTDAVVGEVGNVHVARSVKGHATGSVDIQVGRVQGEHIVAAVTGLSVACHSADVAGGHGHHTHTVVAAVRHVDVASTVQRDPSRRVQVRTRGGPAVLRRGVTGRAGARHRRDGPGRDFTHPLIRAVADVEVAGAVHHEPARVLQRRTRGGAAVPGKGARAVARHRRDGAGRVHPADAVVAAVRNVEVAGRVHGQQGGVVQGGASGRPAVLGPRVTGRAGARHRRDDAGGRRDFADALVRLIRNVEVARAVHRHPVRGVQGGRDGQPTVLGRRVTRRAGARHRRDKPGRRRDLADALVGGIRNVDVARRVHGDRGRLVQIRPGAASAVPVVPRVAGAGERGDVAVGVHLADAVVRLIRNVDVAGRVQGHPERSVQAGGRSHDDVIGIAVVGGRAGARHRRDNRAVRGRNGAVDGGDFTDAVVALIRNVHVAGSVKSHTRRIIYLGAGGGSSVPRDAARAGAGHRRDDAREVHFADAVVVIV